MAKFAVMIRTPAVCKPTTRPDDVTERATIQRSLMQVVHAVSNTGAYDGTVSDMTGDRRSEGTFGYFTDDQPAEPSADSFPPWRDMRTAPRDGRWILLRMNYSSDGSRPVEVAVAAQFVPEHGAFCALAQPGMVAAVQFPLHGMGWMPQPPFERNSRE